MEKVKMENNIGKPVSCKDFFPSGGAERFPPGANENVSHALSVSSLLYPPSAGVDSECGLFPEMRGRNLYFIRGQCTFPLGPSFLCLQDGRKVVVSEGRGTALWCYVLAVPVVVL